MQVTGLTCIWGIPVWLWLKRCAWIGHRIEYEPTPDLPGLVFWQPVPFCRVCGARDRWCYTRSVYGEISRRVRNIWMELNHPRPGIGTTDPMRNESNFYPF
jgi:hypothetical protein